MDIADFVGRKEVLSKVLPFLVEKPRDSPRIVNLYGMGGIGKTTLGIRLANLARPLCLDGQLFVDLGAFSARARSAQEVLEEFLTSLGVARESIPPDVHERASLFRSITSSSALVVMLDNADTHQQVSPLLPSSTAACVIVTSRQRISQLPGASFVHLPTLDPSEARALLAKISGIDAIEPSGDRGPIDALIAYTGSLPLGVRVAGAVIAGRSARSIEMVVEDLRSTRTTLLSMGDEATDLRVSLSTSLAAVPSSQRRAFALLGLVGFQSFTAWELAALSGGSFGHAVLALDGLTRAELVQRRDVDLASQQCYGFHDLVRELARDEASRLTPSTRKAALDRLWTAYLTLAADAEQAFQPGEVRSGLPGDSHRVDGAPMACVVLDPIAWAKAIQANYVETVRQAHAAGRWSLVWRLSHRFAGFFESLALWDQWRLVAQLSLDAAERDADLRGVGCARLDLAAVSRDMGQTEAAMNHYSVAQEAFDAADDTHGRAYAALGQGLILRNLESWDEALVYLRRAMEGFTTCGDRRLLAQSWRSTGLVEDGLGQIGAARRYLTKALQEFGTLGDMRATAYAHRGLGHLELRAGDATAARAHFRESLSLLQRIHDLRGQARALIGSALAEAHLGRYADSRALLEAAKDFGLKTADTTLSREVENAEVTCRQLAQS